MPLYRTELTVPRSGLWCQGQEGLSHRFHGVPLAHAGGSSVVDQAQLAHRQLTPKLPFVMRNEPARFHVEIIDQVVGIT